MKKISTVLKNNYEFVARPFALVLHYHDEYLKLKDTAPVDISTPINFSGPVTGLDTISTDVFTTAGETISALRILSNNDFGKAVYTDPTDPDSIRKIIGMSVSAGAIDSQIKMLSYGKHIDGGLSLDINLPLFLGTNGTITQVAPVAGSSVVLGHAQSTNTLFLDIKRPIILA